MKNSILVLSLTLFIATTTVASERWELKEAPAGLGAKWIAEVKNTDGDTLKVFRKIGRSGYEAFAELTLSSGKKFNNEMPFFQIDNGKLEDTTVIKRAGDLLDRNWGELTDNKAHWRIWTSPEKTLQPSSELAPWIKGNKLTIKYKNQRDEEKLSTFSLSGSGKAIQTAITGSFQ